MTDPIATSSPEPGASRPYRGLDPAARRADRRERLLEATLELASAHSFPRTTIQDICREAGVTARHFYEEFGTREDLLEALYRQLMGEASAAVVVALADAPDDLGSMIHLGLPAYVHSLLDDPRRGRITMVELSSLPRGAEIGASGISELVVLLEGYGAQFEGSGELAAASIHDTAVAISGAMKELLVHWIRAEQRRPLDELIATAEVMFRRLVGLPGREPAPEGVAPPPAPAVVGPAGPG